MIFTFDRKEKVNGIIDNAFNSIEEVGIAKEDFLMDCGYEKVENLDNENLEIANDLNNIALDYTDDDAFLSFLRKSITENRERVKYEDPWKPEKRLRVRMYDITSLAKVKSIPLEIDEYMLHDINGNSLPVIHEFTGFQTKRLVFCCLDEDNKAKSPEDSDYDEHYKYSKQQQAILNDILKNF